MYDPYLMDRRHNNLDMAFPLRTKFVERPEMLGREETQDAITGNISGEVELIARTAYRLGHAEEATQSMAREADREHRQVESVTKELYEARLKSNRYEERAGRYGRELEELKAELKRKDNRIKRLTPKKEGKR